MMHVCVTSAYPDEYPVVPFRECAERDRFGVHQVSDDPEKADLILFVEHGHYGDDPLYRTLRRHPYLDRYRRKCLMYNEHDRPWYVLPGVYCSMPASHFDPARQRAGAYLRDGNDYLDESLPDVEPQFLYSFIGTLNCRVRARILDLTDPEGQIQSARLAAGWTARMAGSDQSLWRGYADVMARSRFILCPRGHGTATYRLFEAMRACRVPVILSDQWVAPEGPDWERFSLRVPESQVAALPDLLRRENHRWREMAREARAAWEEWFAPDVKFHRIVESCARILPNLSGREPYRLPSNLYLRWLARVTLRGIRGRVRGG